MKLKYYILLSLCLFVGIKTSAAISINGIYYTFSGNGAMVMGLTDFYPSEVNIPNSVESLNGKSYNVTSIAERAFSGCSDLTSITIPNSVTSIGYGAFENCTNLTSITIPESVTSVGGNAFVGTAWYNNQPDGLVYVGKVAYKYKGTMPANTSIMISNGTTEVVAEAFYNCSGLTSVTIPYSVTSIGEQAFYNCTSLTTIEIPNGVTSIGRGAFWNCSGLSSIDIPNSVTNIRELAFYGTPWYDNQSNGLVYAGKVAYKYKGTMPEGTEIIIEEGTLGIAAEAFYNCSGLISVTIPYGVTCIGNGAFRACSNLNSVSILNSVTSIGDYAFYQCSSLTSVTIPESVTSIGVYAFSNLASVTVNMETPISIESNTFINRDDATLYVPAGSKAAYEAANYWNGFKEIIEMEAPSSITVTDVSMSLGDPQPVSINLTNTETNLVSFQMDLTLPDGITVNKSGCSLSSRFPDDQELTIGKQPNGDIRLTSTSFNLTPISGTSGKIITLSLTASADSEGGTATIRNIRFVTSDSQKLTLDNSSFNVTIAPFEILATGISLSSTTLNLTAAGQTATLAATVAPNDATNKSVTWMSSDTNVATVSDEGVVTAVANGTATITAITADGTNLSAQCTVTVDIKATGISLNATTITLNSAGQTSALVVTVTPSNATNKSVTWTSSDTNVATVSDEGVVTAVANGTATITATTADGTNLSAQCTVTVDIKATGISLNATTITLNSAGQTSALVATVTPSNATNKSVTWTSSDTNVATVSDEGVVTAVANGTATITATTADGTNLSAQCTVTVDIKATGISLNATTITLNSAGQTSALVATVTPSNATNKSVTWTSSDTNVATVSDEGVVTAVANGTATITATTADGTNLSALCTVTVDIASLISFADTNVKALCVANWDTNGDGELSEAEAAAVTDLGTVFKGNNDITSFNELQYFTGLTTIGNNAFDGCTSLTSIAIPTSLNRVKTGAFKNCTSLSKVIVTDIAAWCGIIYEGEDWNGDFPLGRALHLYSDENTEITEVIIPEGVARIEPLAFRDAKYITSVTIPSSVTYIGLQAFRGMHRLTSINLPNGLTSIAKDLFSDCQALPTVTIPGSVTSIGSGAFWGCSSMNSINILDGVRIISQDAFDGCRSLTSITIPKSVTNVGLTVFQGCTSLTSMIVDEENTTYDSRNNCNAIIETATNTLIAGCQNTIIPESVTSIASYAFQGGCTGTTPVLVIPAGMRKIGDYSIDGCTGLTDVWCYATQVPNTSSNAFNGSFIQYKTLHVPAASLEAYSTTAPWSDFGTIIAIEEELNTENVDIASAEDLANFAARVNAGEIALSATLKADIDFTAYPNLMIGNNSYYRGEFNGAGHSIKLALNRTSEHAALFYRLSGYVHDLTITGTITTSAKYAGGIAGETSNATIERCQSRVNIISTVNGDGTHGGIVGAARPGSIIRDCLFSGSITGSQTKCCGGVSGWSVGSVSITNCLIKSTFSVSTEDSDKLSRNSSTVTSSNNYFQGTWDAANNCTDVTLLTENQVESGEACYLLNNGRTDDEMVWYQTLGVDDCPVPDKRRLAVLFDNGAYVNEQVANIAFADANVKAICVANWDTNGDGELSEAEAAAVTDLGEVFKGNRTITSFNELQYFTGLTSIRSKAFCDCRSLTSVTIPDNVTSLANGAFWATGLTSITIPNSVTSIGQDAFNDCQGLTTLTIPGSVTEIGPAAFYACRNLASVVFEEGVTIIGDNAFHYCNSLASISFPNSVTRIGSCAFSDCSITSLTLPSSVTSIGGYAFSGCTNLTSVTMPASVITFNGTYAFGGGTNHIESVYITDLAAWLGIDFGSNNPLRNGAKLYLNNEEVKDLVIPDGTTAILGAAFEGCETLTSVTIPNSVTSIAGWAFNGCSNLTTVTIPNSITNINSNAFMSCGSLMDVWCYAEAIPSTGNDLFLSTDIASATLHVPAASLEAYSNTAPWSGFGTIVSIEIEEKNYLTMADTEGIVGGTIMVPVCLENEDEITAFQLEIDTPDGVSVSSCTLTGRKVDHTTPVPAQLSNGNYQIVTISGTSSPFSGNEGVLLNIVLTLSSEVAVGDYPIIIKNIELTTPTEIRLTPSNVTATLTVKLPGSGDVNGDGKVTITDAVGIVNYILERPSANFRSEVADLNGDGRISITDAVAVVNRILIQGSSSNAKAMAPIELQEIIPE